VVIDSARMYFLVDNHDYGSHELELRCSPGVAAFAFTFTSCIDPVASACRQVPYSNLHNSLPDPRSNSLPMKRVVAGFIEKDGKLLVCQRTRHQTMPLKWEFPGGKIEEGEQPRDASAPRTGRRAGNPRHHWGRGRAHSARVPERRHGRVALFCGAAV
jgi:hypothetical protein